MDPALKVGLLTCINIVIWALDLLLDLAFGWTFRKGSRQERKAAKEKGYELSAQLVRVLAKSNSMPEFPTPKNSCFVYCHEAYVDPRRAILDNDEVALSHLNKDEAVFAVADPGVSIADLKRFPFHCVAVYNGCHRHIKIPISTFHRLAEEVSDPASNGVTLGVIGITVRCGSTLLNQVMHRAKGTRSLSEPYPMDNLWVLYTKGEITLEELRLLCKKAPGSDVQRVFIKLYGTGDPLLGMIREEFPETKMVLSIRHPKPSIISFRKLVAVFATTFYGLSGRWWREQANCLPIPPVEEGKYGKMRNVSGTWWPSLNYDSFAGLNYAACLACVKEYGHVFDQIILYEDFMSSPRSTVESLFLLMGVKTDAETLQKGLSALERDSQSGIFSYKVRTDLPEELERETDQFFIDFDLGPGLSVGCSLEEFRRWVQRTCPNAKQ